MGVIAYKEDETMTTDQLSTESLALNPSGVSFPQLGISPMQGVRLSVYGVKNGLD